MRKVWFALVLIALVVPSCWGGLIVPTRADLLALLGASAVTEGFETYTISPGNATLIDTSYLDSTTVANGQGPGLVIPGVSFSTAGSGDIDSLQWDGAGYFGAPSKELLSDLDGLLIDFSNPTPAFGMDVRAFSGYDESASIFVYSPGGGLLYSTSSFGTSGAPVFFGYQDTGGIGSVLLVSGTYGWSPIIDNVTFGQQTGVPEPATILLMAAALAGLKLLRRR